MSNEQLALKKFENAKNYLALAEKEQSEGLRLLSRPGKPVKARKSVDSVREQGAASMLAKMIGKK